MQIPDKLYFRIGEVAGLCGVPAYVLRFWESEFPQLKPNKGGSGQRLYRRRDVETALRIKELLYEGKFTIAGARQQLKQEPRQAAPPLSLVLVGREEPPKSDLKAKALQGLQKQMLELLNLLASKPGPQQEDVAPPEEPKRRSRPTASASSEPTAGTLFE